MIGTTSISRGQKRSLSDATTDSAQPSTGPCNPVSTSTSPPIIRESSEAPLLQPGDPNVLSSYDAQTTTLQDKEDQQSYSCDGVTASNIDSTNAQQTSHFGAEEEDDEESHRHQRPQDQRCLGDGISVKWLTNQTTGLACAEVSISRPCSSSSDTKSSYNDNDNGIRFCLIGYASVGCIQQQEGAVVDVLGVTLCKDSPPLPMVSPFWSSWMTFHITFPSPTKPTTPHTTKLLFESMPDHTESTGDRQDLVATEQAPPSQLPSFRLVPPDRPTVIPPTWRNAASELLPLLQNFQMSHHRNPNKSSSSSAPIVCICGAKGVGKSTLLRYLTNRLLSSSQHDTVAILDADVGQPELAPPGVLSWSLQHRYLLHPPYWNLLSDDQQNHHTERKRSIFFGAVSSKPDPSRYIAAMRDLIQDFQTYSAQKRHESQDAHPIPLIVNLDGWIKGMGAQILTTLLKSTLQPTYICQIQGDSRGKSMDLNEILQTHGEREDAATTSSSIQKCFVLPACTHFMTPVHMPAFTLRTLRLAAYFASAPPSPSSTSLAAPQSPKISTLWQDVWNRMAAKELQTGWIGDDECSVAHRLARALPYGIPMECVDLKWMDGTGGDMRRWSLADLQRGTEDNSMPWILQAMNGNMVGLVLQSNKKNGENAEEGSNEVEDDCFGLGIVRSVDWRNRMLYLLTPARDSMTMLMTAPTQHRLELILGQLPPLPKALLFRGVHAEAFPYLSTKGGGAVPQNNNDSGSSQVEMLLGSEPMKSRNNIGRRGGGQSMPPRR